MEENQAVSSNESPDTETQSPSLAKYSDSKNVFGVEMSKAEPAGTILTAISIPVTIVFSLSFISTRSFMSGVVAVFGIVAVTCLLHFRVSERRAMEFNKNVTEEYRKGVEETQDSKSQPTKAICRECHAEISPGVKRCPNCGWKPTKRGGLWWGATAVTSLTPIGWALGAKGASDNYKASKGVSKEVRAEETDDSAESEVDVEVSSEANPTDTLERLSELQEQGAITEAEFEEKKKELLDRI